MKITDFGVEIWMNKYENECTHNIAETCVESLTVEQLLDIAGKRESVLDDLLSIKLTYGPIEGSDALRDQIAAMYETKGRDNVTVTHGAIGANSLVHQTLVSRGDHVISVLPTYQQHYSIPESIGADVEILHLREENGFLPDLDELKAMVTDRTRLIAINNPNNPTGSLMDKAMLEEIGAIADAVGAYVLCDEVYRGIHQEDDELGTSIVDVYSRGISTASMSKSFSLAGLRLGWIVAPRDVIDQISIHRDYNTISVGMIDDYFATMALANKDAILTRSREIVRTNLAQLDAWVQQEPNISYVKPKAGTTALLKYDSDVSSEELAEAILAKTGVLLTPGSALFVEGYLRIGYANNPTVLAEGLEKLSEFLPTVL